MQYVNNYIFILGIDLKISRVKIRMVHLYIGAIPMEKQKSNLLTKQDSKVLSTVALYIINPCVIINAFQVQYSQQQVR